MIVVRQKNVRVQNFRECDSFCFTGIQRAGKRIGVALISGLRDKDCSLLEDAFESLETRCTGRREDENLVPDSRRNDYLIEEVAEER